MTPVTPTPQPSDALPAWPRRVKARSNPIFCEHSCTCVKRGVFCRTCPVHNMLVYEHDELVEVAIGPLPPAQNAPNAQNAQNDTPGEAK